MLSNPKKLVLRLLVGFALTMIAACGGGTKAMRNSTQALSAAPSVCSPLTTPYNACVVADASGHVDRAGLQSLIDQASAQYVLRPASLGPIQVTLPGELSYTLDGTLNVGAGVHLVGTGPERPRLISAGDAISVQTWVQAARTRAESFVPRCNPPYEFVREPIHHFRCASAGCSLADLELGLADLDAWLAPTYVLLCPDDDCAGTAYRYFDILHDATVALDEETDNAYPFGYHAGWVDVLLPGYEYAGLPGEYNDPVRVTADPVIALPGLPPAAAGRLQTVIEHVAIECARGPYVVVARGTQPGNRALGIMIGGGTGFAVEDVVVRGNEIDGCAIGIQSINSHHVHLVDNDVVTGVHPAPVTSLELDPAWTVYQRNLALDLPSANRGEGYNGIRIHGTLDRGIRIEGNHIGRVIPGEPAEGPIRGIHVHGTNPGSREDFVIVDNVILHAQDNGIDVEGAARDIIVTRNTVESMGRVFSPSKASYAVSFRCHEDKCESGFQPHHFTRAGNFTDAGIIIPENSPLVYEWCNVNPHLDSHACDHSPVIEGCTGGTLPLTRFPLGQPLTNRVAFGRTVTFAPPAPTFTAGCSAAIGPDYRLVAQTPAGLILFADFGDDAPLQWTPQASLPGAHTFRLFMRSRDALAGDPPIAETQAVTIQAVSSLSGSAACTTPGLSFVPTPGTARVAISPATPVTCTSITRLEYQLQARRVGTTSWSTVFGYGPSATFIWNRDSVDPSDQFSFRIRYRRQGSNVAYEHSTPVGQYP